MILVDSSVWIDYFSGRACVQTDYLDGLLGRELVLLGDLILTEVLQGIRDEREFMQVRRFFAALPVTAISSPLLAVQAAQYYRTLRAKGITVRKTIDSLIATRCIVDGYPLLFSDKDFAPFVEHLGLVDAMGLE